MDWNWIAAVSGFALTFAGTPGPTNTVLTACGAMYGFRRTLPYLLGIALSVALIFFGVSAAGAALVTIPLIRGVLKWIALGYVLCLAWGIGIAAPNQATASRLGSGRPMNFLQGVAIQFINPKLWTMMAAAVAAYGTQAERQGAVRTGIAFGLIFGIATFIGCSGWALLGAQVGRVIKTERAMRLFNWSMAALLIASVVPVILD